MTDSPPRCAKCVVGKLSFCSGLEERTAAVIANRGSLQSFSANQVIWDSEGPLPFVGIILSGYIRMQRYGLDGRRQIVSIMMPGDLVGSLDGRKQNCTVEASTDVEICRVDHRVFTQLLEQDRFLQHAVYDLQRIKLAQLHWLTWSLGGLGADERVAAFLATATTYMPYQPQPDGSSILTIELPRTDIADMLGTSVETVCRILKRFEETGVLELVTSRHLRILSLKKLIAAGCLEGTFEALCKSKTMRIGRHVSLDGLRPYSNGAGPTVPRTEFPRGPNPRVHLSKSVQPGVAPTVYPV